jgi:hypothetical protein
MAYGSTDGGTTWVPIRVDANGSPVAGGYTAITTFRKAVTVAGTAEQIVVASTPCKKVILSGATGNTDLVVVGDSAVVAAHATQRGIVVLSTNNPVVVEIDNLNKLWVDAISSGDAVCGAYFS